MEKAARLLGFRPRYSPLETALDAIDWLVANGEPASSLRSWVRQ